MVLCTKKLLLQLSMNLYSVMPTYYMCRTSDSWIEFFSHFEETVVPDEKSSGQKPLDNNV